MPFKLSLGMEAIVPIEILSETSIMKVKQLDVATIMAKLDLLKGVRERVAIKMVAYKRRATEYFN